MKSRRSVARIRRDPRTAAKGTIILVAEVVMRPAAVNYRIGTAGSQLKLYYIR
jgi:hypothetical protein